MIIPKQAPVRPRVTLPEGEGDSLLEEAVRARLDEGEWGIIELTGAAGAGKSTAIGHLAYVLGAEARLRLADRPDIGIMAQLVRSAANQLVVCVDPCRDWVELHAFAERWRLARWTDDDCIEYLLAAHPEQCGSVMRRLQADRQRLRLAGLPELWRVVLDQFAADESAGGVNVALLQEVARRLVWPGARAAASAWSFGSLADALHSDRLEEFLAQWNDIDVGARSLLRHTLVQYLLAADYLAEELRRGQNYEILARHMPLEVLQDAAAKIRGNATILRHLNEIAAGRKHARHPMTASLLHATQTNWRPADGWAPLLCNAYLAGAEWPGIRLSELDIRGADLSGADLSEAQLHTVSARLAQFTDASLHGAQLLEFTSLKANFAGADLSHVRAPYANFQGANLEHANLEGALLKGANLTEANLSGCNFQRADLREARLNDARLAGADFSGANLSWACLNGLALRQANFTGAQFAHVAANKCDLEYMRLPGANFERATLRGALLTGSQMPDACFRYAQLAEAGLADIDWERADLRCADLRGCTFHLGSSRSGLVDSPSASEGSRTGFYTDEYLEQDFKAPEEIRKANLCGANLRGALIDNVDFYLVDLRGALYTDEQEAHFRRCRAILETRV